MSGFREDFSHRRCRHYTNGGEGGRVFIFLSLKEPCTSAARERVSGAVCHALRKVTVWFGAAPRSPRCPVALAEPPGQTPAATHHRQPAARPGPVGRDAGSRRAQNDPVGGDPSGGARFRTSGEEREKDPAARRREMSAVIDFPMGKQNSKHSDWRLLPRARAGRRGRRRAVAGAGSPCPPRAPRTCCGIRCNELSAIVTLNASSTVILMDILL